jgi:hypothetical protein
MTPLRLPRLNVRRLGRRFEVGMRKAFFTGAVALSLFAFVASSAGTTPSSQSTSLTIRLISIIGPPRFKDRPPRVSARATCSPVHPSCTTR